MRAAMAERMGGKRDKAKGKATVVIRKEEAAPPAAHGGAWKVAYADFVTAMMAFFLLMWLLNATTEEQRRGLADYFAPSNLFSHGSSGTGDPFGGHTAFDQGAMVSDRGAVQVVPGHRPAATDPGDSAAQQASVAGNADREAGSATTVKPDLPAARPVAQPDRPAGPNAPAGVVPDGPPDGPAAGQALQPQSANPAAQEKAAFEAAAREISAAVQGDPDLAELAKQLAIDITPEGLRIQIMDEAQRPMFALGSADPNQHTRQLLAKVAPVLLRLRHAISIAGYTDAARFPGPERTNWELSTERANTTRHVLVEDGFPEALVTSVTGHADHDLLLPADPLAAANRRVAIVVLRTASPHAAAKPAAPAQ
ncbi:MAG TPA: flagellar motor protein MotB [Acetobacteraceae bacterium]|nr:flagellar motor protein MotB [Acetobacteraceae bacterium]